jgi:hypothetical protein
MLGETRTNAEANSSANTEACSTSWRQQRILAEMS